MKTLKYKIFSLIVLFITISVQAQKFDKKITEKFKVNSDVTIVINATHTDIDVETWNKNEVSIEAFIEVEGAEKDEAKKIIEQWKFEALGNKNKVKVSSSSGNMFFEFNGDFNFDFPEIDFVIPEIPEMNFVMPEISEIDSLEFMMPLIEFPEMEIEIEEFDYEKYKKDTLYLKKYKTKIAGQVEKFKNSDWKKKMDSFRNSDEFKRNIEQLKSAGKRVELEMKALRNSEEFKKSMEEAKKATEEATKHVLENKKLIEQQTKYAKQAAKEAMKMFAKMKEDGKINRGESVYFNNSSSKNSNVKIKKYIKIKVPKNATFDLNVRHGKMNIPESNNKMSVNMEYGNFTGGEINGEENSLIFLNTPVSITTLNSCLISLKNVPNATFGTFSNNNLLTNSSNVFINEVGEDVSMNQKFGNIEVKNVISEFKNLSLMLDYAKFTIPLDKLTANYVLNTKKSRIKTISKNTDFLKNTFFKMLNKNETSINGNFSSNTKTENLIDLVANFSTITIK